MFNPPIAWALTAAEIAFGGWVSSIGYPTLGGIIMGLAAGCFITRASIPRHIAQALREDNRE